MNGKKARVLRAEFNASERGQADARIRALEAALREEQETTKVLRARGMQQFLYLAALAAREGGSVTFSFAELEQVQRQLDDPKGERPKLSTARHQDSASLELTVTGVSPILLVPSIVRG